MPQDFVLNIPFPVRENPDYARAFDRSLEWVSRVGLACSEESLARVREWDMAGLAASCWPEARGEVLDVLTDMCNVFTVQDDILDGAVGPGAEQSHETNSRIVDTLLAVNRGEEHISCGVPLVDAWADVWRRLVARRSPGWRDRALRQHDQFWLRGFTHDAYVNRARPCMAVDEFNDMRLVTIGVLPMLDYGEVVGDFELPAWLYEHDLIQRMRRECALACAYINDVASVEKDAARGEQINIVFALQREYQCMLPAAMRKALSLTQRSIDRLQRQDAELDSMFVRLELDEDQRRLVRRYIQGVEHFLVGTDRWQRSSGRYRDHGILPPSRALYPDDVTAPIGGGRPTSARTPPSNATPPPG